MQFHQPKYSQTLETVWNLYNIIKHHIPDISGSGKRALLEVISRRSRGPTRGQILLDGTPMTLSLYQRSCGYVSHRTDLIPSLTAEQTLHYAANLTVGSQVITMCYRVLQYVT